MEDQINISLLPIAMNEVESSQIHSIGYDATSNTMAVRFKNKGAPGSLYHYRVENPNDYADFLKAESKGSHFFKVFKADTKKYPYQRIVEKKEE